jgi:hypothetical protein
MKHSNRQKFFILYPQRYKKQHDDYIYHSNIICLLAFLIFVEMFYDKTEYELVIKNSTSKRNEYRS